MSAVLGALLPIFLIIALGAAVKRTRLLPDSAWPGLEKATYFIFFPVFLFRALADANFAGFDVWPLAFALLCGLLTMAVAVTALRKSLNIGGAEYSSVFQGALRWNSFVAVAVLQNLYGKEGISLAAVAFAALVPVVNTLSVFIISKHATAESSAIAALKSVARNPLVIACLLGIAAQGVRLPMPSSIDTTMALLAGAAVPIGLFTVGGALSFGSLKDHPRLLILTAVLKLVAMPLFMTGFCIAFGVTGMERAVALVAGSVPTATNAYILARQLGGHAPLMANIVTTTTIAALFTMPLMVWLLR